MKPTPERMNWNNLRCQEAAFSLGANYIECGRPATHLVFHEHDGRNVYLMCDACAYHNVKNRGAVLLMVAPLPFRERVDNAQRAAAISVLRPPPPIK